MPALIEFPTKLHAILKEEKGFSMAKSKLATQEQERFQKKSKATFNATTSLFTTSSPASRGPNTHPHRRNKANVDICPAPKQQPSQKNQHGCKRKDATSLSTVKEPYAQPFLFLLAFSRYRQQVIVLVSSCLSLCR